MSMAAWDTATLPNLHWSRPDKFGPITQTLGLVSIGTGRPQANTIHGREAANENAAVQQSVLEDIKSHLPDFVKRDWKVAKNLTLRIKALVHTASALAKFSTNSEDVHERVQELSESPQIGKQFPYFRFNVARYVGDIGLGDWTKSEIMAAHIDNYMREYENRARRTRCVKFLVQSCTTVHRRHKERK